MAIQIASGFTIKPIGELRPFDNNAKRHPRKKIRTVARSIQDTGFNNPILVDPEGNIVAGHCRYLAANLLGLAKVPIIVLDHLTEGQIRLYRIADNRLAETGSVWSKELLSLELTDIATSFPDLDLTLTGFDAGEVELLQNITLGAGDAAEEEELTSLLGERPTTALGDIWQIGRSKLLCGDSKNSESYTHLLGRDKVQMVLSDLPYNVKINKNVGGLGKTKHREFVEASGELNLEQWTKFLSDVISQMARFSRSGSLHYLFMDWRSIQLLLEVGNQYYNKLLNLVVWKKSNAGMGSFYRSQHELIAVFRNGSRQHTNNIMLGVNGRNRTNIWEHAGVNSFGKERDEQLRMHPTCKPVPLLIDAIKDATHVDELVLDPFGGSGSTAIAAEQIGRQARLIELDPAYCDVTVRRAMALDMKVRLAATGQSFEEVRDERRVLS